MKAQEIVSQLTLEEKAGLCSGLDFWNSKGVQQFDLLPVMLTDGPHGLRKQAGDTDHLGINESVVATCFPTASTTACSFDRALMHDIGNALGEECLQENVSVLLGPGANIKRSPLCGRNFEYISEDPCVTGELASAIIDGVQEKGVGTSLKHFAANNQEKARMYSNSVVDERALREIYLSGFETAIKKSQPWTVMCAYNRLNGVYACENPKLLTEILRKEWGFDGLVVTDWGAMDDRVDAIAAGLDLEMPASGGANDERVVQAVRKDSLSAKALDDCAKRVVQLLISSRDARKDIKYDKDEHHMLARRAAAQSAVLLKNEELLPASTKKTAAVVGAFAATPRYQGAGSSKINPPRVDCALDALRVLNEKIVYAPGYSLEDNEPNETLISEACEAAKGKDIVFIFVGLPDAAESEGFDRNSLSLPESHNQLVDAVSSVNPNVVVIIQCGAPVVMPWMSKVKAALLVYLGGQAGGSACADLLYGISTPSGKLAETFPLCLEDTPAFHHFAKDTKTAEYRESIFVGYRWYDAANREVAFPFGHGLSYTSFAYRDLHLSSDKFAAQDITKVTVTIQNTGNCYGGEVVQLYVEAPQNSAIYRAPRELKGFEKVFLEPGESKEITFMLNDRSFAYYNAPKHCWAIESGVYTIAVGTSSRVICLSHPIIVRGDDKEAALADLQARAPIYYNLPQSGSLQIDDAAFEAVLGTPIPSAKAKQGEAFTRNSTLGDISSTPLGAQILQSVSAQAKEGGELMQSMLSAMLMDLPVRALGMFSGGAMTLEKIDEMIFAINHTKA